MVLARSSVQRCLILMLTGYFPKVGESYMFDLDFGALGVLFIRICA